MNAEKEYEPGKAPFIYGIMPGLTERGKIKIGRKGETRTGQSSEYQLPTRLDYFLITTLERDTTGNFMRDEELYKALGFGEKLKKIPIMLLFDEIPLVFQYRYTCYKGKTLFCSGDGRAAHQIKDVQKPERVQVVCPCFRKEPTYTGEDGRGNGKCKINGKLSVVITGANVIGGVWVFRTTGYNSTVGIISSLTLIKTMTGGILAGIPLVMTIQPKVATNPIDGKSQTIQVVGIEYAGTMDDLQNGALKLVQKNAEYRTRLGNVQQEVIKLISFDAGADRDDASDIVDEFHPEEAVLVEPERTAVAEGTAAVVPVQAGALAPDVTAEAAVIVPPAGQNVSQTGTVVSPDGASVPPAPKKRGKKPAAQAVEIASGTPPTASNHTFTPVPIAPMVDRLENGIAQAQQSPATAPLAVPDGAMDVDLFD
jgi:hypothetical protein